MKPSIRSSAGRPLVWSLFGGLGIQCALVVSGVLAARMLGVENRGHLALIVLFPAVLTQLGGLGLPLAVTYYIARDPDCTRPLMGRLVKVAVLQAAALVAIDIVVINRVFGTQPREVRLAAWTSLLAVPATLAEQYALATLQGLQRFFAFNVLRVLAVALYSGALVVAFLASSGRLLVVALAWTTAYAASGIVALLVALRSVRRLRADGPTPSIRTLFRFGLRGLLGWVSPIEGLRVDQQAVGLLISPAALGLYVVGQSMTNLPRFIAQSIGLVGYPHVASAPRDVGRLRMWRFFWLSSGVCVVVVLVLELLARKLILIFFGADFGAAVSVTRILLVAAFFVSIRRTLTECARGLGYPVLGTVAEGMSWLVVFPGMFLLGRRFGLNGIAVVLVVASAMSFAVLALSLIAPERAKMRLPQFSGKLFRGLQRQGLFGFGVVLFPLLVLAGLATTILSQFAGAHLDVVLMVAIALIATLPIAVRIWQHRFDIFEPITIVSFAWLLLFVARPVYDLTINHYRYLGMDLSATYRLALGIALASVASCTIGYFSPIGRKFAARLPRPARLFSEDAVALAAVTLTALASAFLLVIAGARGGFGALLLNRSAQIPQTAPFIAEGFLFAVPAVLLLITAESRHRAILRAFALVPLAIVLLLALPGGNRRYLLPILLALGVLYYLRRFRRPSLLLSALMIAVLLLGVIDPTRDARTGGMTYSSALANSVSHPGHAASALLRVGDTAMIDDDALLLRELGRSIPFRHGREFLGDTVLAPIPRQVWDSKPQKVRTLLISHYFGTDRNGGCLSQCPTLSLGGEAYADFGFASTIVISALFGIFLATGYHYFRLYEANRLVQVGYSAGLWLAFHAWEDGLNSVAYTFLLFGLPIVLVARIASNSRPARHHGLQKAGT